MSDIPKPALRPLSKNPLIQEAFSIAETIYQVLPQLPDSERWDTTAKLRQASNSLLCDVARGVANTSPNGGEYDWSNARKDAAALLTMYRFADKQGFLKKRAALILKLDALIKAIDIEIKNEYQRTEDYRQYELSAWQDKYDIWQKLNKELKK